jgi:hypothetical protein
VTALAWLLIILSPIDWWAAGVVLHALRRHREANALRGLLAYFGLTALAATAIAVIALNYLLGMPLPRGAGFALLAVALVLMSVPAGGFLFDHYRRR